MSIAIRFCKVVAAVALVLALSAVSTVAEEQCPFANSEPYREIKAGGVTTVRCRCTAGYARMAGAFAALGIEAPEMVQGVTECRGTDACVTTGITQHRAHVAACRHRNSQPK